MTGEAQHPAPDVAPGVSRDALRAFHAELRTRNLGILFWSACVFNTVLVAWSLFDWLLAPQHWRWFLMLRLAGSGFNTLLVYVVHRPRLRSFTNEAFVLWVMGLGIPIVPMLFAVDQPFLAYALGYTAVVLAIGVLPLWSPRWAFSLVGAVLLAPMAGFTFWQPLASQRDLYTGFFYIATVAIGAIVMSTSRYYLARRAWLTLQQLLDERAVSERLRVADKLKDEFLANVSHELRTPLNGIIGLSESMMDESSEPATERQRRNLQMISASGRRLANLVNDILDFSRLKNRELTLSLGPVDLRASVGVVLSLIAPLAKSKRLELRNRVPSSLPAVWADEDRVQQVLLNLVGNAVKFTESGFVELDARVHGGSVLLTVRDSGIGIPEDKQQIIFESFEQADASVAREYGGTGLGLAITKKLLEMQGGGVSVRSRVGEGAEFTVSLPVSQDAASGAIGGGARVSRVSQLDGVHLAGSGPLPVVPPSLGLNGSALVGIQPVATSVRAPTRILVVDDEPVNLQVVTNLLVPQGYDIRTCSSGIEALAILAEGKYVPDMLLLDVMMPKMSGYEVLERIRADYPTSQLPVILLTAKNQVADLVAGFEAGANDYLTKPISKGELLSRLKTHLQLAKVCTAYGRFVPHEFIRHLAHESILEVQLGDQVQKEMAVLFSDIRSFTELSEGMNPEENFNFLNSFLNRVAPVIAENGGFIDQYIGDAVMALFPGKVGDAVGAAAELRKAVRLYNIHRQASGYRAIQIGTGVHVGPLILGTIGYEQRMQTTVIADSVNQASRLEGLTKFFGLEVLLSEAVVTGALGGRSYAVRSLGRMRVKGKRQSISIYELLDGAPEPEYEAKVRTRETFEAGVRHMTEGDVASAVEAFASVLKANSDDTAAQRLLERATYLLGHPEARNQEELLVERRQ